MSIFGSEAFGSHFNLDLQNLHVSCQRVGVYCIALWVLAMLFLEYVLQGTEQAKRHVKTLRILCVFVRWGEEITLLPEGNEKEIDGCCYCYYLHYHFDQY